MRQATRPPSVYLGGVSSAASMRRVMSEGFDFIVLGRALLNDPDLLERVRSDAQHRSACTHCNLCVASMALPAGLNAPGCLA